MIMIVKKFHGAKIVKGKLRKLCTFVKKHIFMKSSILDRLRDTLQLCSLCAILYFAYTGGVLYSASTLKVLAIWVIGAGGILFGKLFCTGGNFAGLEADSQMICNSGFAG